MASELKPAMDANRSEADMGITGMAESPFNPYRTWLNLDTTQPTAHQLLGVSANFSLAELEQAFRQRIQTLRVYQTGAYALHSRRLLAEVTQAYTQLRPLAQSSADPNPLSSSKPATPTVSPATLPATMPTTVSTTLPPESASEQEVSRTSRRAPIPNKTTPELQNPSQRAIHALSLLIQRYEQLGYSKSDIHSLLKPLFLSSESQAPVDALEQDRDAADWAASDTFPILFQDSIPEFWQQTPSLTVMDTGSSVSVEGRANQSDRRSGWPKRTPTDANQSKRRDKDKSNWWKNFWSRLYWEGRDLLRFLLTLTLFVVVCLYVYSKTLRWLET